MILRRGVILACISLGLTLGTTGVWYLTNNLGTTLVASGVGWIFWAGVYAWLTKPRSLS
jgi:heme O synthase-like polyprenyltransferase